MKFAMAVAALFCSVTVRAQDLSRGPEPTKANALAVPAPFVPTRRKDIYPDTRIPDGMVWRRQSDRWWQAEEIGSCEFCGRPMTFKQAAFDKKASSMWLSAIALTIADIELGQACIKSGRCMRGNPLFGRETRKTQYSVRLPAIAASWMSVAMLRKGDKGLHIGGMKHWYEFPLAFHAASTVGVISELVRH
jgi:hypothetical protein